MARVEGDLVYIPLTMGKTAVVDLVDADLGAFNWAGRKIPRGRTWYAKRHVRDGYYQYRKIALHVEVAQRMGLVVPDGMEIDHADGNGLNCRRGNLRAATRSQNVANAGPRKDNKSGRKGVIWDKERQKWRAQIRAAGKFRVLGRFDDLDEAAAAYAEAARRHHGQFARMEASPPCC